MLILLIVACFTICFIAWAYAEREETRRRQEEIKQDLADLKVLIEAEAYKDKTILDKRVGEVEI